MGSYYYLDDQNSEMGYFPLPEEEYLKAYKAIVKRYGLKITDRMIIDEYLRTASKGEGNFHRKPRMVNTRGR